jgi:hypothetical protein
VTRGLMQSSKFSRSMARTGVGSAVQLSTYDGTKNYLLNTGWFHLGSQGSGYDISKTNFRRIELHFCASLITSFFVCIAMNPFDVASVRMYNQQSTADGKPGLYRNGMDCIVKVLLLLQSNISRLCGRKEFWLCTRDWARIICESVC